MNEICFITDFRLDIDRAEVWRWLGSHGRKGDPRLEDQVEAASQEALALAEPRAIYTRVRVRALGSEGIWLENGERLNGMAGPYLSSQCTGADEIVVAVTTIGPRVENRVQQLFQEKRPLEAVILDAAGSAASSAASRYVNAVLYSQASTQGLKGGRILRPGSHYWDILGQRVLFSMLPTEQIGVTLTTSCLILPKKSGSGIIPFGRELVHVHQGSEASCRYCPPGP